MYLFHTIWSKQQIIRRVLKEKGVLCCFVIIKNCFFAMLYYGPNLLTTFPATFCWYVRIATSAIWPEFQRWDMSILHRRGLTVNG